MNFSNIVKEEIKKKSTKKCVEIPAEIKETLEEIFNHNDNVVSNRYRISIRWVSNKLKEQGYLITKDKLSEIAISMGRKSWAEK